MTSGGRHRDRSAGHHVGGGRFLTRSGARSQSSGRHCGGQVWLVYGVVRRAFRDDAVMIVVTGAAGFIGANNVKALNERGERDILAVDNLSSADKFRISSTAILPTIWTSASFWIAAASSIARRSMSYFIRAPVRTRWRPMAYYDEQQLSVFRSELFGWCQQQKRRSSMRHRPLSTAEALGSSRSELARGR